MDNQSPDNQTHATHGDEKQPIFNVAPVVTTLIILWIIVHVVFTYLLSADQRLLGLYYGAFIPARYTGSSSWTLESVTSIVTYSFMHSGLGHLAGNSLWLLVFGSPLAYTIGAFRFLLFWVICAAGAALFHFATNVGDMSPMVGASGAIAGCMGAAARFGFVIQRGVGQSRFAHELPPFAQLFRTRTVPIFLIFYLLSNIALGVSNQFDTGVNIAWQAHIGGILAGFLLISFFLLPQNAY